MPVNLLPGRACSRRRFLGGVAAGASSLALAACASTPSFPRYVEPALPPEEPLDDYALMYGPIEDEGYRIPAIPIEQIDPRYLRQWVDDPTGEAPGTLVVDTTEHFLYLVKENRRALRYGVGLGKAGFEWSGRAVVQWKQKWPKWTPPDEMVARDRKLAKYSADNGGMPPGLTNPLGARALYLFQNGEDTLYRLHGSPEWRSIGKSVSSGCVRFMNQDIIDLYDRVPNASPVVVTGSASGAVASADGQGEPIDDGVPEGSLLLGRL